MNTHTLSSVSKSGKLLAGLLLTLCGGQLLAQEKSYAEESAREGWVTDFEAAKKTAVAEDKDLLLEFTRSKGCGWCIRLENEVFAQDSFKKQVPKDYVLVKLDFPRDQELPAALKKQNVHLFKHYGVRTFPYMVLCDADGRPYASMGYQNSNVEKYLKTITAIRARRNLRDQALEEAESLEGEPKARMLEKALSNVSSKYHHHYTEIIDTISKSDPKDTSGFIAKIRVNQVNADLSSKLKPLYHQRKYDSIPEIVDTYITEHKLQDESLQVALVFKIHALYYDRKYPEAMKIANEALAINDTSDSSRYAKMLKKRIEKIQQKAEQK